MEVLLGREWGRIPPDLAAMLHMFHRRRFVKLLEERPLPRVRDGALPAAVLQAVWIPRIPSAYHHVQGMEAVIVYGHPVEEKLLQHFSPLGWDGINLTGDYT